VPARDRFIGFAFAGAHLLLETDKGGRILYAAGARCGLVDGPVEEMVGASLADFMPPAEHALLARLLMRLVARGKLDPVHVRLQTRDGTRVGAMLGACRLPLYPDRCFLALTVGVRGGRRDAMAGLPELGSFLRDLETHISTAVATGRGTNLTLLLIDGLREALAAETPPAGLRESLETYLMSVSADGDGAALLADDRYALIHGDDLSTGEITRDIGRLLEDHGAGHLQESLHLYPIELAKAQMPVQDMARALAFSLREFAEGQEIPGSNLTDRLPAMLERTVKRVEEARRLLQRRSFTLAYQPILHLTTGTLHHHEALLRPEGAGSPADFVRFVEEVGLHADLDLLVLQSALEDMKALGAAVPQVAVNLSSRSLDSGLFLQQVLAILAPYGKLVRKLLVEVTETAVVENFGRIDAALQSLRRSGVRVCLDDVGAGTTSFRSLKSLTVDFVKLDGALVRQAVGDRRDRAVLTSILDVCRSLDVRVIAEQIETDVQRKLMADLGVGFGQGYLFARPQPRLPPADKAG